MRRRRHLPDEDMVEVELVDAPEVSPDANGQTWDPLAPATDVAGDTSAPERPRRSRPSLPALAALLVTVVAVVGANVAEASREAARREALADVPCILTPVDEPLTVSWEVPGTLTDMPEDLVLLSDWVSSRAIDPTTGATLWTREDGEGEGCRVVGPANVEREALWRDATVIEVPGPRLLGCSTWEDLGYFGESSFGEVGMDVIEAFSGEFLHRLSTSGAAVLNESIGAEVVLAVVMPAGTVAVQRWDPVTGELLSEAVSADTVSIDGSAILRTVERFGDTLVVNGDVEVAFALTTGVEIDPADIPAGDRGWPTTLPLGDGGTASWTYPLDGGEGKGAVTNADGTERFALPGPPAQPMTSDDSLAETLLVSDGGVLVALDAATGVELWETELLGAEALVLIDGRLVLHQGNKIYAVDARDGSTLWIAGTVSGVWINALTDGELLLAYENETGADGPELVARQLTDGEVRWRSPLPSGTNVIMATPDGQVVGATHNSVFGMGVDG